MLGRVSVNLVVVVVDVFQNLVSLPAASAFLSVIECHLYCKVSYRSSVTQQAVVMTG